MNSPSPGRHDHGGQATPAEIARSRKLCRSCFRCRSKKIKCGGDRPSCASCVASGHACSYLEDARRTGGTTKGDVSKLHKEISQLLQQLEQYRGRYGSLLGAPAAAQADDSAPNASFDFAQAPVASPERNVLPIPVLSQAHVAAVQRPHPQSESQNGERSISSLSPSEAHIAGAFSKDGHLQVHGITSTFHQESVHSEQNGFGEASASTNDSISQRLISYAALQKQQETFLFSSPANNNLDLDGVSVETAKHLLGIHWNRQHFTYLLTYRPAIMESLRNGGPYINKLLLNAIYFTSCQYSDRVSLRADPNDAQSMGAGFYRRFKELLVDEIDRPSIPTAIALLLCGQCLVAYGKQGGGWILCGTAYRMIIELGCHLSVNPKQSEAESDIIGTEVRKRLYWGAFVIDKFQSLYLGRAPALRQSEARVSKQLLDTFEEYESWSPNVDPDAETFDSMLSAPSPRPAYGVSSFNALLRLAEIATEIIETFYTIDCLKFEPTTALEKRRKILDDLDRWQQELPSYLRYNPEGSQCPPPHQLNPHTTYWTLKILVWRPFMSNGHLSACEEQSSRAIVERECASAALKVWGLVKAYKDTFTLRRAPYILCFAAYHAVQLLVHAREVRVNFPDCLPYLWSALIDLKHGNHAGLTKPLQSLKSKLSEVVPTAAPEVPEDSHRHPDSWGRPNGGGLMDVNENAPGITNADFLQNLDFQAWNTPYWLDSVVGNQLLQEDTAFGLVPIEPFSL